MNEPAIIGVANPAIRLSDIGKVYRLYQKPFHKFLDLFGLCPAGPEYYAEHSALSGVNVEIRSGEKIAIIGRNGAGKSTMLKVIMGLVQPTSGVVQVHGRISNLLQIGTGFHPDFTGRQNVFANLAHQGIIGDTAAALFEEIVQFAEIEEYIDQPMKTYSTGMCSRLMFSSSVVVAPEILLVDEILGVGDAYFAHKSFGRMRDLCANAGTTLLLVTHDVYSALNLCDRFIWIDRGRIKFDGPGKDAVAMYESSIKEQEEQWLRQNNAAALRQSQTEHKMPDPIVHVIVRSRTGFALNRPLALADLELFDASGGTSHLPVADGAAGWHLMPESNIGEPEVVDGRRCRSLQTFGTIYHKAEWTVQLPAGFVVGGLRVRWKYGGSDPVDVRVVLTTRTILVRGSLPPGADWQEATFCAETGSANELDTLPQTAYGTGAIRIVLVEFLDHERRAVTQVKHGDPLIIRVHCRAARAVPQSAVTFSVGFARQGSAYQCYINEPHLPVPEHGEFVIESRIDALRFGSGIWYIHAGVGAAGMFERTTVPYFSLDSAWYHLIQERFQLSVLSVSHFDASGCFVALSPEIVVHTLSEATQVAQTTAG